MVPPGVWPSTGAEDIAKLLPAYSGKREDLEQVNLAIQLGPGRSVGQAVNPGARRTHRAHASIGSSFELTITDLARTLFKETP